MRSGGKESRNNLAAPAFGDFVQETALAGLEDPVGFERALRSLDHPDNRKVLLEKLLERGDLLEMLISSPLWAELLAQQATVIVDFVLKIQRAESAGAVSIDSSDCSSSSTTVPSMSSSSSVRLRQHRSRQQRRRPLPSPTVDRYQNPKEGVYAGLSWPLMNQHSTSITENNDATNGNNNTARPKRHSSLLVRSFASK